MGENLGSIYHVLWNEVAWLYAKWEEYVELFGSKPSRIDIVNEAAGQFFRVVQDTLWEDTLLHIARLTDPPRSMSRDNLTVRRLPELIQDETVRAAVQAAIEDAAHKSAFCRDWRNRQIAHKDLKLALVSGAEPLQSASRALVAEAMESIANVLNTISLRMMDSTTSFEGIGSSSGALALLYVIDDGLKAKRERKERRRAGTDRAEDYQHRDL